MSVPESPRPTSDAPSRDSGSSRRKRSPHSLAAEACDDVYCGAPCTYDGCPTRVCEGPIGHDQDFIEADEGPMQHHACSNCKEDFIRTWGNQQQTAELREKMDASLAVARLRAVRKMEEFNKVRKRESTPATPRQVGSSLVDDSRPAEDAAPDATLEEVPEWAVADEGVPADAMMEDTMVPQMATTPKGPAVALSLIHI